MTQEASGLGGTSTTAAWLSEIGIGTWTWDPARSAVEWDAATESVYGLEPGSFPGTFEGYIALIHPDDRDEVVDVIQNVAATGGDYSIRHRVVWPDGSVHWVEGQGRITVDESGAPLDGRGIVYLLSDRLTFDRERTDLFADQQTALADSVANRERLRFLIDLTDAISGSLNSERVARQLVGVISERLATTCIVDVKLQDPYGHLLTCVAAPNARQVVMTGTPAELPAAAARFATITQDGAVSCESVWDVDSPEQAQLLPENRQGHPIAMPLVAHGSRIGTLIAVRPDREWSQEAQELIAAACRRAAGAFDRAELHADRSKFVSMFQAAATPRDLPTIPGLDIAVHYRPATDLVRLGGDLYDIFELPDGTWMFGVGDVCGKGIIAAGHAELSRTALRAAAIAAIEPAETLHVLNRTLLAEPSRPMLTAALLKVYVDEDSEKPSKVSVDISVAGHPAPVVIEGEDSWRSVPVSGTMLGVTQDARFTQTRITLAPGESITLFTDGVTESRFGNAFFGVERLGRALCQSWPASARALVAGVGSTIETWAAGNPADDLLLLVIRVPDA